ncbi:hypothetical protein niasHT_014433 [Heterodera trifolii]|uniref:Uncharacterized protein n=1 Tax=Heterodera trifolii TaxID=157864 RepID=A0ABD2KZD3_9BILA
MNVGTMVNDVRQPKLPISHPPRFTDHSLCHAANFPPIPAPSDANGVDKRIFNPMPTFKIHKLAAVVCSSAPEVSQIGKDEPPALPPPPSFLHAFPLPSVRPISRHLPRPLTPCSSTLPCRPNNSELSGSSVRVRTTRRCCSLLPRPNSLRPWSCLLRWPSDSARQAQMSSVQAELLRMTGALFSLPPPPEVCSQLPKN